MCSICCLDVQTLACVQPHAAQDHSSLHALTGWMHGVAPYACLDSLLHLSIHAKEGQRAQRIDHCGWQASKGCIVCLPAAAQASSAPGSRVEGQQHTRLIF